MEKRIKKLSWDPSGLSGIKLTYFKPATKGNVAYQVKNSQDIPWPVQGDLLKSLKALSVYATNALEIRSKEVEVQVTGYERIESQDGTGFKLSGAIIRDMGDGERVGSFETPEITMGAKTYQGLAEAIRVIEQEHLSEYTDTKAKIQFRELAKSLVDTGKTKAAPTMEQLQGMTDDEVERFCTDFLEKKRGKLILDGNDMVPTEPAEVGTGF